MNKNIVILGSTGSIGTQALEVVENLKNINIIGLSTNTNIGILEEQIRKYKPMYVCVMDIEKANILKENIKDTDTQVLIGKEGLIRLSTLDSIDIVLNSLVGNIGLLPTIYAIRAKKDIALANKETLVSAGELVMKEAQKHNVNIYPIDSEHSAIFQCLQGNRYDEIERIILTASGGPFREHTSLENVTLEQALNHPNWSMGKKITIDSATLMNKGLEVIEAKWLFNVDIDMIEVIIHPQSIIHSMVEYKDSSIIAQLGTPDMKVPIQYALAYPKRVKNSFEKLDLIKHNNLTFRKPNYELFPCLKYAFEAIKIGGTMPCVLNASNEIAVEYFLNEEIKFTDIPKIVYKTMECYKDKNNIDYTLEDVLQADEFARDYAKSLIISKNF
ncbi:1-deoxy-D-xylulose-5-phosphate reductoisomerase [uncultured Tyzzerella sp.]|uniref:1-deoxy-D-xylulose-5-phosphate reductoisomerase n=1 Tax=uncultured Tyzzerella sp. TaxID=2321398 RepID=UPI00294339E9|nr:1-deoxy-D-xylulose-5-phosphate reductoisomerase [uncultured Tyzzerella sp.]